ncbi:MAG: DUF362 domain-containing protein [Verrucomicrobia bacterium]|nr:DUF362 domain-containing protein [Verrucomicrobiota bacterium]
MNTRIHTAASARLKQLVFDELRRACDHLAPRRIVLKPNWVLHETDAAFPIRALVTDARVIEATAEACLNLFPQAESILVGDCPLQYAKWPRMCAQSGLTEVINRLAKASHGKVVFRDLRKEVFQKTEGSFLVASESEHGDPSGYRVVALGNRSHLEPISDQAERFAVNDYSAAVTSSNHRQGSHNYFVSQSVLNADLFINLPKWKAHAKSGITGALKNLVGINGDKAYLPHFRRGAPKWGGDEYGDQNRWLYWTQTTLRETLQKRSRLAFKLLKPGWELLKKLRGIETRLDNPSAVPKNFYIAGGAWHGNETIWRMIYDLNLVIQCMNAEGKLQPVPQRNYFCIVDGLISGEGNGPLEPLPRETDWLLFGDDPFAIDAALCHFMGFAPEQVPVIAHRREFAGPRWGKFDLSDLEAELDGKNIRVLDSPINFHFVPPPGWRNHIER